MYALGNQKMYLIHCSAVVWNQTHKTCEKCLQLVSSAYMHSCGGRRGGEQSNVPLHLGRNLLS